MRVSRALILVAVFGGVAAAALCASPAAINLPSLQSSFSDWDGTYNEFLESWTFQKFTPSEGEDYLPSTFYVDSRPRGDAGSFDDYAKNLMKNDWLDLTYVWTEISSKEKFADGFLFVGKSKDYKDPKAVAQPAFVMVRMFKNVAIVCKGDAVDTTILGEAIAFCKAIK
jgi:hypothetical protein